MKNVRGKDWLVWAWDFLKHCLEIILLLIFSALQLINWTLEIIIELMKKLLIK